MPSTQVPPFLQGLAPESGPSVSEQGLSFFARIVDAHSSMSVSQLFPVYPGIHSQA